MPAPPDLLILGQVTVDDVVPPAPAPWRRQLGGSSLYAVAGARLWIEPARIGLIARVGCDYPFDVATLLRAAGLEHFALAALAEPHLIEWLIYEADGSRRSLPRNPGLLEVGAEGAAFAPQAAGAYRDKLLAIAPTAADIPTHWLPAAALHLCPQAGDRQRRALHDLRGRVRWLSVDPSPHVGREAGIADLAETLRGARALLPSANDIRRLLAAPDAGPHAQAQAEAVALELERAGFAEVLIKRGAQPVILAHGGTVTAIPTLPAAVVDPTGAGDSFCGAYAACRLRGFTPDEAARRATASAARIVGCSGVEAALNLAPDGT